MRCIIIPIYIIFYVKHGIANLNNAYEFIGFRRIARKIQQLTNKQTARQSGRQNKYINICHHFSDPHLRSHISSQHTTSGFSNFTKNRNTHFHTFQYYAYYLAVLPFVILEMLEGKNFTYTCTPSYRRISMHKFFDTGGLKACKMCQNVSKNVKHTFKIKD